MLHKLKPKSEFSRNVLTLMTGTTIAQAIPIAISPILTRIYTPEDFGVFALYMSLFSILSVVSTGRYELAILLPRNNNRAKNIFYLSIFCSVLFSLLLALVIYIFESQISLLLKHSNALLWLHLLPISILFYGIFQSSYYYNLRAKRYKYLSKGKIYQSLSSSGITIAFYFFKNAIGLIIGHIVGQIVFILVLVKGSKAFNVYQLNYLQILYMAKIYIKFPKYNSISALLNYSSLEYVILFISSTFNPEIVGIYFLSQKILFAPSGLIGSAVGQVFIQKSFEKNRKTRLNQLFHNTIRKLFAIIIFPTLLIYAYGQEIFLFFFGSSWEVAGLYAQVMLPYFVLRFIGAPISTLPSLMGYQKSMLLWNIYRLFGAIIVGYLYGSNLINFITIYSLFMASSFIILLIFIDKITKKLDSTNKNKGNK